MARIKLVIADRDEDYIKSLENFLMGSYSYRFEISSFTREECLYDFLSEQRNIIDVLLVSQDMYSGSLQTKGVKILMILSEGKPVVGADEHPYINKYQQGDRLAGDILNKISETSPDSIYPPTAAKNTRTVAVFSPAGGTGKTCIAASASMLSARKGLKTFYLNLENTASTAAFFDCSSDRNMSNILYSLKDKDINLALRIEGLRCVDAIHKVHYFSPPESARDLYEAETGELIHLVEQLKALGQYDVIFIDLSAGLNPLNVAMLGFCDEILLILTQDAAAHTKAEVISKEYGIFSEEGLDISTKTSFILNKYKKPSTSDIEDSVFNGREITIRIPYSEGLMSVKRQEYLTDLSEGFAAAINQLVERYG